MNKYRINIIVLKTKIKELLGKKAAINYKTLSAIPIFLISKEYNTPKIENDAFFVRELICGLESKGYDESKGEITLEAQKACGGTIGPHPTIEVRKIVSAQEKDDEIVVKEKAIYYDSAYNDSAKVTYYHVYNDKNKLNIIESNIEFREGDEKTITVDSYIDKASTITHTFKLNKDTGKYYFAGSKIE